MVKDNECWLCLKSIITGPILQLGPIIKLSCKFLVNSCGGRFGVILMFQNSFPLNTVFFGNELSTIIIFDLHG